MPALTCPDCDQVLDADPYPPGVAGLIRLCGDCALRRLRVASRVDERDELDRRPAAG